MLLCLNNQQVCLCGLARKYNAFKLHQIFCPCYRSSAAVARSFSAWRRRGMLCISGFMYDVIIAHMGKNMRREKRRILKVIQQGLAGCDTRWILKLTHQRQHRTGAKSDVYDCLASNEITIYQLHATCIRRIPCLGWTWRLALIEQRRQQTTFLSCPRDEYNRSRSVQLLEINRDESTVIFTALSWQRTTGRPTVFYRFLQVA